jgi:hypothetical protein
VFTCNFSKKTFYLTKTLILLVGGITLAVFVIVLMNFYFGDAPGSPEGGPFSDPTFSPEVSFSNDLNSSFPSTTELPANCYVQDSLDYYYYKDTDSLWEDNNKFGLYVYAEERDYFEIAQKLVNSNGGEWGYVLIPYNMDDRDLDKWRRVFGQLMNKKLIPIVQLWKLDKDNYREQTKEVAEFFNRFVWPIKYRYISVYNEPNDAAFWEGEVSPEEYAEILEHTIDTFNKVSDDYFLLNGAFNISASTTATTMDAFTYMYRMQQEVPGIFEKLDGWASHSYPQPNFTGNPYKKGRWSIAAYEDELAYLKDTLGVEKELPVFITETGWAHAEGENYNAAYLTVEKVAEYFEYAYQEVWLKDSRVRAVTPFTIRYEPPFDHFSWISKDEIPYAHYDSVRKLQKEEGSPPELVIDSVNFSVCADQ